MKELLKNFFNCPNRILLVKVLYFNTLRDAIKTGDKMMYTRTK